MAIRDILIGTIRTMVPWLVGLIVSALTGWGIVDTTLQDTFTVALDLVVSTIITGVYYVGVRFLEERWPTFGILLGWKAAPRYVRQTS